MTPKRRPAGSTARVLHDAFEIGITAKAAFAAVETLAGIAMFFLHADWVRAMARWLTASELGEDPGDLSSVSNPETMEAIAALRKDRS